jgi:copper chaperone
MITFNVPEMTCGHCVSSITQAITQAEPQAKVSCDLASHQVKVENADAKTAQHAIEEAGYTVTVAG